VFCIVSQYAHVRVRAHGMPACVYVSYLYVGGETPSNTVLELGQFLNEARGGPEGGQGGRWTRESADDKQWSVFDSSGVAVQDVCIAKLVSEMLVRQEEVAGV